MKGNNRNNTSSKKGAMLCKLGQVKTFSCSGTSETSRDKYVYVYKPLNDGYNMSISGTITY